MDVTRLLTSKVFYREFEFAGWPGVHENDEKVTRPYNGSIFTLRDAYKEVFPDIEEVDLSGEPRKVCKIIYTLNLLPNIDEPAGMDNLLKLCVGMSDEDTLPIFTAEPLVNLIEYKWDTYAYKGHYVGCMFHMCYIVSLSAYIALTYL